MCAMDPCLTPLGSPKSRALSYHKALQKINPIGHSIVECRYGSQLQTPLKNLHVFIEFMALGWPLFQKPGFLSGLNF